MNLTLSRHIFFILNMTSKATQGHFNVMQRLYIFLLTFIFLPHPNIDYVPFWNSKYILFCTITGYFLPFFSSKKENEVAKPFISGQIFNSSVCFQFSLKVFKKNVLFCCIVGGCWMMMEQIVLIKTLFLLMIQSKTVWPIIIYLLII